MGADGRGVESIVVSVEIAARPATVWRCLVEEDLLSTWLSAAATIEPRVGGKVRVDFAKHGCVVEGVVEELRPNASLVFSWGVASGAHAAELPLGSTRVRIALAEIPSGTRVTLRHEGLPSDASRRDHALGWNGYMGALAGVAPLSAVAGGVEAMWDAWFAAWAETDAARRDASLARIATDDVVYVDVHADVRTRAALSQWMAACQAFFPGAKVARDGPVLGSRGALLVRWKVAAADGSPFGRGASVARLSLDGRLADVRAFWES